MEASREHPWVSRMNLSIFRALIRTISFLWVNDSRQKRSRGGRMRSSPEKESSATSTYGANLIVGGTWPSVKATMRVSAWIFSLSYVSKDSPSAIISSKSAHWMNRD